MSVEVVPGSVLIRYKKYRVQREVWRQEFARFGSVVIPIDQLLPSLWAEDDYRFGADFLTHMRQDHFCNCRREKFPEIAKPEERERCNDEWIWVLGDDGFYRFRPVAKVVVQSSPSLIGEHPRGIKRIYDRTDLSGDLWAREFIMSVWDVLFPSTQRRRPEWIEAQYGRIHFECFRIKVEPGQESAKVVSGFHLDGYAILGTLCVTLAGHGATSHLRSPHREGPVFSHELQPGQLLLALEETPLIRQLHKADDLLPPPDGPGLREMLIIGIK